VDPHLALVQAGFQFILSKNIYYDTSIRSFKKIINQPEHQTPSRVSENASLDVAIYNTYNKLKLFNFSYFSKKDAV